MLLGSDRGRITAANPFMTELLGYSHAEILGQELWEIGLLQDKEASREAFQRLKREEYIRYEDLPLENRRYDQLMIRPITNGLEWQRRMPDEAGAEVARNQRQQ